MDALINFINRSDPTAGELTAAAAAQESALPRNVVPVLRQPPVNLGEHPLVLGRTVHRVATLAQALDLLRVPMSRAAKKMAMPRTTAWRLVHEHQWPARVSRSEMDVICSSLATLMAACGASRASVEHLLRATRPDAADLPPLPPLVLRARKDGSNDQLDGTDGDTAGQPTTEEEDTPMLMAKQTLGPAARKAFQLFTNPFDGEVIDDAQMYTNGEIAYVREACMQAATGGRFVAVVSESGGGKTTMLQDLEARLERDRRPVIVIKPWVLGMEDNDTKGKTLKSTDILASIVTTLDALAHPRLTLQARSNQARDLLIKSTEAGYSHLLMIEEAHSLPEATLKHLKRLHEMRLGRKPLLGILLLGQTELALRLDPRRASLREVTQRCEVVHLLPLDGDLRNYLAHRAKAAGRDLAEFIDDGGVDEIRARLTVARPAGGGKQRVTSLLYPLAVNNLVTAALNTAAELGVPIVTRDVVRGV